MKIEFAKGLSLPEDAATQTFGIIARKRAGKSYAAGKLVEGFAATGTQFVVMSPLPNWWGLRLAADGKSPGIDVPLLGGLRGDIPLNPESGKLIADAVIDTGRSFVLDVSQFSFAARKRFAAAFGEQLWQRQKALEDPRPVHVVLEEAQLFLPQNLVKGDEHMVGVWTEIVRLGGNCGIGVTLITQRPQSVAKEALTQVECLVVLQVNGVPEKKALKAWIVERADAGKIDLLEELPFLQRGVAYVWSPQWLEHFGKHEILPKWTFDSGATPKVGAKRKRAELKPIDLDALKAAMAETVKKAEENDPAALKRRIRELEVEVMKKHVAEGIPSATVREMQHEFEHMHAIAVARFKEEIQDQLNGVTNFMSAWKSEIRSKPAGWTKHMPAPQLSGSQQVFTIPKGMKPKMDHAPGFKQAVERQTNGELGGGAKKMLTALVQRQNLSRTQMATLAGLSPRSGTFATYLARLRAGGYITQSDVISDGFRATLAGMDLIGPVSAPQSTAELLSYWGSKLPGKVNEMLNVLVNVHPKRVTRDDLAQAVGLSPTSGTFATYLSKLRGNALAEGSHELKASDSLFI